MHKLLSAVAVAVLALSATPTRAEVLVSDHVRGYCLDANMGNR